MMLYQYMQLCPGAWSRTKISAGSRNRQRAHGWTAIAPTSILAAEKVIRRYVDVKASVITWTSHTSQLDPAAAHPHLPDTLCGATALEKGPGDLWYPGRLQHPPAVPSPTRLWEVGMWDAPWHQPKATPAHLAHIPLEAALTSKTKAGACVYFRREVFCRSSLCLFAGHKMVPFYFPSAWEEDQVELIICLKLTACLCLYLLLLKKKNKKNPYKFCKIKPPKIYSDGKTVFKKLPSGSSFP